MRGGSAFKIFFFDEIDEAVIEASTPYGKFSTVNEQPVYSFFRYDDDRPCFLSGGIDSIAEYDQYIVMAADSSYLLIDQRVKGEKAIKILSLTDLPVDVQQMSFVSAPKYIKDLYWRVHHDNHHLRHQNPPRFGVIRTGYGSGMFSV